MNYQFGFRYYQSQKSEQITDNDVLGTLANLASVGGMLENVL